jgi:TonB-dependent receptor
VVPPGLCRVVTPQQYASLQQWATGNTTVNTAKNSYTEWLPSLNLKADITDQVLMRFAVSKVMTRPDNSYVRNFLTVGIDSNGNGTATAGNPYLVPATAWQFDLTGEWYFSKVGSLTFDVFYKDVAHFFYQQTLPRDVANNGVVETVYVRGPQNYDGHGQIKGFEVAYQQTYDFLPGLLSGLGINANYTYIDSQGLPNSCLNNGAPVNGSTVASACSSGTSVTTSPTPNGHLPLEQLSKHNVNVAVFYEKGPISARVAYNWRSRFLLTASDVIFPYYSIFNEPTGQLDASLFVSLNKHLKVGVQGVNLTDEVTKTTQAYTTDPNVLAPRSYFMNDRRFSFIIRGSY